MSEPNDIVVKHTLTLQAIMREYLSGGIPQPLFTPMYIHAYQRYVHAIDHEPLEVFSTIAAYCEQPHQTLKNECVQALQLTPYGVSNEPTRDWITQALVIEPEGDEDLFWFFHADGTSKFGTHTVLHTTVIEEQCFFLSALNGSLKPAPFKYDDLLQALKKVSNDPLPVWAFCSEVDGIFASTDWVSSYNGRAYDEPEVIRHLEQMRGDSVQWGPCYLLLIPTDRSWVLVNRYDFGEMRIELHAPAAICDAVLQELGTSITAAV